MKARVKSVTLYLIALLLVPVPIVLSNTTSAGSIAQQEVPISVYLNANVSQGLIYVAPLPVGINVFGNNYYISNSLGYVEQSYLFSADPPLLVWYEPFPKTQNYYFVFGGNTQSSGVTTGVFSFYTQFYYLNTSIFDVSGVSVLGGLLVLNGNNSKVTFTSTAIRYPSALALYNFLSSQVVVPTLTYSGSIPPGSIITLSVFSYSKTQTIPLSTAVPFGSTTWAFTSDTLVNAGNQLVVSQGSFKYSGQSVANPNNRIYSTSSLPTNTQLYVLSLSSTISLNYPTVQTLANDVYLPYGTTVTFNGTFAVSQAVYTGVGSVMLVNPVYFFNPTLLNGSNIMVYNNSKWYSLPANPSLLKLDPAHIAMFILPSVVPNSNYIYLYDVPAGSQVTVKYSNGTSYTFVVSGQPVNTIGSVNLVNVQVYGVGVVSISIQPALTNTQVRYNLFAGIYDFNNKAGLIINSSGVYIYNGKYVASKLTSNVMFPSDVGVGYTQVGSTFYLVGFYFTPGGYYTFITPLPITLSPSGVVPYVNYNGTVPVSISTIAVTLSNGLYYEASGLVSLTVGQVTPLQSAVLSFTTSPGLAVVNGGSTIYQTKVANTSASLTLIGFSGYTLSIQYGNVLSQVVVPSNFYPTNLPTNLQVVVVVNQATRTITISTSPLPVKPVQIVSINVTNVTATAPKSGFYSLSFNSIPPSLVAGYVMYYGFIGLAIASYRYSEKLWSSTLFMSFATMSIAILMGAYTVLPFSVGAIIVGYILKRFDI